MATRIPLVVASGQTEQLQSGDTLLPTVLAPTAPTVVGVGTVSAASGVNSITTPGMPAGILANDILLWFVQTQYAPNVIGDFPQTYGYAQLGPSIPYAPPGGTPGTAGNFALTVYWKRAVGGDTSPSFGAMTDHCISAIMAIRGCPTDRDPFHLVHQFRKNATSTAYASESGTTTIDNCLIVYGLGHNIDANGAQLSGITNASLTNLTERLDDSTNGGTGGGFAVVTGNLAQAGDFNALSGTWAATAIDATMCFSMLPADTVEVAASTRGEDIQTFYALGGQSSSWKKPYGAKSVEIIAIGAGGGGGNGRSAATAAAGAGGGGGGHTRKIFAAADLPSTLTVTAGYSGAGAAHNVNGAVAGGTGGNSTVANGSFTLLTAAGGVGGVANASAAGGAGGAGGGRGTAPATASPGAQGLGGQGGGGTTANTGAIGGAGDEGGGGGGSGRTGTNSGGNGGASNYGGGGGGAGVAGAATVGIGGAGGGGAGGAATVKGSDALSPTNGGGGGGGGSTTVAAGNGGFPGGGGGGGGAFATNTKGGDGGDGVVVIITRF